MRSYIRTATAFAAVSLSLLAGCDSDTTAAAAKPTVDTWPAQQTAAYCAFLARCGESAGIHLASSSSCSTLIAPAFFDTDEGAMVAKGVMAFDATAASQCLANVATADCSVLMSEDGPAGCNKVFVGAVANGAACSGSQECAAGFCDFDQTKSCTVCKPFIAIGEACTGMGCAAGASCVEGKCIAQGTVALGGSCADNADCVSGHFCDWDPSSGAQKCAVLGDKDAKCDDARECKAGLACVKKSQQAEDTTCQTPGAEGSSCFDLSEPFGGQSACATGVCGLKDGTSSGKCFAWKKVGEACESSWQCGLVDAWCDAGKCALLPGVGATCASISGQPLCQFGTYCGSDSKCAKPTATGPCLQQQCAKGSQCFCSTEDCSDGGTCKPNAKAGEACGTEGAAYCEDGLSCDDTTKKCVAPTCK